MTTKPKLLLIGYRAYGDWAYTAPVLPLLFEKYDVYADVNIKGYELFFDDPRFKHLSVFEFEKFPPEQYAELAIQRKENLIKMFQPDKIIDLGGTLEIECIPERFQPEFHFPVKERQRLYADKNFYEAVFKRCEIPMPDDLNLDGFVYSEELVETMVKWRERHKGQFVVMMPIAGSRYHKLYLDAERLTRMILGKYQDAVVYLVGDPFIKAGMWKHERIWHCYEAPIKQVFLMTKYADYCVGPETGVMVAAGMHGTPKTMICTASSIKQTCSYQKNDRSVQANVACSPCHRAIHFDVDCENMVRDSEGKPKHSACVGSIPAEQIMRVVDDVYTNLRR